MKLIRQVRLLLAIAAVVTLLSSCGTQNKFASSFSKRHYTKGFYWDKPVTIEPVIAIAETPMVKKTELPKFEVSVTSIVSMKNSFVLSRISTSAISKKPKSKIAQFEINSTTGKQEKKSPPSVSSITSHHEGTSSSTSNGNGTISSLGFFACLAGVTLVFAGVLALVISAVSTGVLYLLGGLVLDVAGIILCVVALATHDKEYGLAIAGIVLNVLLLFAAAI